MHTKKKQNDGKKYTEPTPLSLILALLLLLQRQEELLSNMTTVRQQRISKALVLRRNIEIFVVSVWPLEQLPTATHYGTP